MGNHPSNHQPLDKAAVGKFGDVHARRSLRSPRKMDRLRRSFRDSFRKRKERIPESSKPHMWQADESAVRSGTCTFSVKYLGCVEVFESRGMQVCEEAIKVLRGSRRRPVRATLHVSGDGLRVVEDETKGLIVDQTIEKVSFCAPDRNHERGFSYICRDGTTRRWMCHGFLAPRESGERLSHAVGCAFAVCLERKQRRDKECGVTMTFDAKNNTFTRTGSFRTQGLTERLELDVDILPNNITSTSTMNNNKTPGSINSTSAVNPFAIERPHATPSMLERQGSFRGLGTLGTNSPFKRQMSLRVSDLPSNAERLNQYRGANGGTNGFKSVSPIPEVVTADSVTALCQQLSQGLSQLTHSGSDDFNFNSQSSVNQNNISQINNSNSLMQMYSPVTSPTISSTAQKTELPLQTTQMHTSLTSTLPPTTSSVLTSPAGSATLDFSLRSVNGTVITPIKSTGSPDHSPSTTLMGGGVSSSGVSSQTSGVGVSPSNGIVAPASNALPRPDQWLGNIVSTTVPSPGLSALTSPVGAHVGSHVMGSHGGMRMMGVGRRPPSLGAANRAMSLDSSGHHYEPRQGDPFDADWANMAAAARQNNVNTNPFLTGALNTSGAATTTSTPPQAFQIQL